MKWWRLQQLNMNCKERLDNLLGEAYQIWQAEDVLCYTMDSVLVANFLSLKKQARVLELGAGTGAISLLVALRGAQQVIGVDINPRLVCLLQRSIEHNKLQAQVKAQQLDLKEQKVLQSLGTFDVVVANPPYRRAQTGKVRAELAASSACHELTADLEDFIVAASKVLKTRGRLAIVNLAERLTDTIYFLKKYQLEPKRLQFVHSYANGPAKIFLIEAVFQANSGGLDILPPLVVYQAEGEYTEQLKAYYSLQRQ